MITSAVILQPWKIDKAPTVRVNVMAEIKFYESILSRFKVGLKDGIRPQGFFFSPSSILLLNKYRLLI